MNRTRTEPNFTLKLCLLKIPKAIKGIMNIGAIQGLKYEAIETPAMAIKSGRIIFFLDHAATP